MRRISPVDGFLSQQGFMILDGGLATELERAGHDLNHPLWSARLLSENPDAIRAVHRSYFEAGADCVTTASYQASLPGLTAIGLTDGEAMLLLRRSVEIACEARDEFVAGRTSPGKRPIVAASVGPYGAFLADGSEYRGDYAISEHALREFHVRRWEVLCESPADLLVCETIPSLAETIVLRDLLGETPSVHAWISFSCRDGESISDGTRLSEVAALFEDCPQVDAVGINCTPPRHIDSLIEQVRLGAPTKHIVVYPNSGEHYDGKLRAWSGISDPSDFGLAGKRWFQAGARLIGGCCRTTPAHVRAMKCSLTELQSPEISE